MKNFITNRVKDLRVLRWFWVSLSGRILYTFIEIVMAAGKKKWGPRIFQNQYEIYVYFMKTHEELQFLKLNTENGERFE